MAAGVAQPLGPNDEAVLICIYKELNANLLPNDPEPDWETS